MKLLLQVIKNIFSRKNTEPLKLTASELEEMDMDIMKFMKRPYHKELEKIIISLSDNLANIKEFYENKTQNEFQDDLYDLDMLSKSLKILFEYNERLDKVYSLDEKLHFAQNISEGLTALVQKKSLYEYTTHEDIVRGAKNYSQQLTTKMLNIFTVYSIPPNIHNNLSILIIGQARTGKTILLKEILKKDENGCLLNKDKSTFHELTKDDYQEDIDLFENACRENKNIYIDDVHSELKEELIKKYFIQNENNPGNKLVAVYQGLEDIEDQNLIKKFDLIISTKSSSLIKYKELFNEEDFQRLTYVSSFTPKGYIYSAFNIKKN